MNNFKKILVGLALCLTACDSCGNAAVGSKAAGQVKYVNNVTPLVCMDHTRAGVSLGVMRNGVGSMSTHDEVFYVPTKELAAFLTEASENGKPVVLTFNIKRVVNCVPENEITDAQYASEN